MKTSAQSIGYMILILTFLTVNYVSTQSCDGNAVCSVTDVGFNCICNTGYEGSATGCVNIDECVTLTPCRSGENCTDTNGTYICHCGDVANICGTDGECKTSGGIQSCQCKTGYTGDGVTCIDVDECASAGTCDTNANCTNTQGSFVCSCQSGFTGDGTSCTDIDECTTGEHNCVSPYTCTNTDGGFQCMCGIDASCHVDAQCVASGGTSSCVCNAGYTGTGATCSDIDECASQANNCGQNAACDNTPGNYTCTCNEGFTGDGTQCDGACIVTISWAMLCLIIANVYNTM